jgi:uncharacterized protein (UPF0210 family)
MTTPSRRDFVRVMTSSTVLPLVGFDLFPTRARLPRRRALRVRTITAGVGMRSLTELQRVETTIAMLERAKRVFEDEEYEVQTLRIVTPPLLAGSNDGSRNAALAQLRALDDLTASRGVMLSIGPVLTTDSDEPNLASWTAELVASTKSLNCTVLVASPDHGPAPRAATVAAQTMVAVARGTPGGVGNFRFAALANVMPGTPFFPSAYHEGPDTLAVGMESASLVEEAFRGGGTSREASLRLRRRLEDALAPVEKISSAIARGEGRRYLGIDPSPAPGMDRSIGAAIEALTQVPFGSASTLAACAAVTDALKSLRVRTCGLAGLMLPVLEDPVLAKRATEERYGVQDLLTYSSVCGTGLDVVPIPGDTPVEAVTRIVLDVATLSSKLHKPLSARLFLIPGKAAGEIASFGDNPYLTDAAVFALP